jgi:hypothetical protein
MPSQSSTSISFQEGFSKVKSVSIFSNGVRELGILPQLNEAVDARILSKFQLDPFIGR